jgi:hypothetical protein
VGEGLRVFLRRVCFSLIGVWCFDMEGEVCRLDVVEKVITRVVNLPPFLDRYPSVDAADEAIDSGVVCEVDDLNRVSFFNSACLSRGSAFAGWFRCGVSGGYLGLRRGVTSIANALLYAFGRVLQSKCVEDS